MIVKLLVTFIFLLAVPMLGIAQDFPGYPIAFWGEASINSERVEEGETIKAFCEDSLAGEVLVIEEGIYGYPEPTEQK